MAAQVVPFRFESSSASIRVIEIDGEPWFVFKDIAEALEYANWHPNLIANVPEEWKGSNRITTLGGPQDMVTLSESGLYFFVARSDKPKALPFQKWLAGEVLPALRKRGFYGLIPVRDRMRDHGSLLRVLKQLVGSRDALERQLLTEAVQDIAQILGLKMPDLALLGTPTNQARLEV